MGNNISYDGFGSYKRGVDPEVTCWHCGLTFLCDSFDATCRICGAPYAKERCDEFNFKPRGVAQCKKGFVDTIDDGYACPLCGGWYQKRTHSHLVASLAKCEHCYCIGLNVSSSSNPHYKCCKCGDTQLMPAWAQ